MRKLLKKVFGVVTFALVMAFTAGSALAAYEPSSLLDGDVVTVISNFAADLTPTVLALIAIIIPVALSLWAMGFGIKKGLSFLQRRAQKAI